MICRVLPKYCLRHCHTVWYTQYTQEAEAQHCPRPCATYPIRSLLYPSDRWEPRLAPLTALEYKNPSVVSFSSVCSLTLPLDSGTPVMVSLPHRAMLTIRLRRCPTYEKRQQRRQ